MIQSRTGVLSILSYQKVHFLIVISHKKGGLNMKEIFQNTSVEIICFDSEDIVKTSTWFDENELPDDNLRKLIELENAEKS
jgi:hypothetical protein